MVLVSNPGQPIQPYIHQVINWRTIMPKWLFAACLVFSIPFDASAQSIPHISVFGGYTFVRAYVPNQVTGHGDGFNLNGFEGSVEVKPLRSLGFVADVSQLYGSPYGGHERQTTALFGPRIIFPGTPRITPYLHLLTGFARGTSGYYVCPDLSTACPGGPIIRNVFAVSVGGGMDVKLRGRIWWRTFEVDWLHANLGLERHDHMRLATGIVIRFGR
jgi:hypothetical protein